jgi:hypothetical protein
VHTKCQYRERFYRSPGVIPPIPLDHLLSQSRRSQKTVGLVLILLTVDSGLHPLCRDERYFSILGECHPHTSYNCISIGVSRLNRIPRVGVTSRGGQSTTVRRHMSRQPGIRRPMIVERPSQRKSITVRFVAVFTLCSRYVHAGNTPQDPLKTRPNKWRSG